MIKFNINIRANRVNKLGLVPLYLTVFCNGQQAKKQLKYFCVSKDWISEAQALKPTPQNMAINLFLANLKQNCSQLVVNYNFDHNKQKATAADFLAEALGLEPKKAGPDRECFFAFFNQYITNRNVSHGRLKHYYVFIDQMKEFAPKLKLSEVDYNFLSNYFIYLNKLKNANNTQIYKLKIIKLTISEAYKVGILKQMPNLSYKIKKTPTGRIALTENELNNAYNYYKTAEIKPHLKNTLQQFLFMCYTGLRYGDLKKFNTSLVKENVILLQQGKTLGQVQIPLNKWARELMPEYAFKVLSNEKTNANLKVLAPMLNIKTLTCHIARHTFGTMCLNKGMGIDTVSNIMGHTNTNVTKIYAKMLPTFKVQEMAKWG